MSPEHQGRCRLPHLVALAVLLTLLWALSVAADASACEANSALGGYRSFLPDCREYELVSPSYKDGAIPEEPPSNQFTISSNGEHALAEDLGGFAGAENDELNGKQYGATYEFTRTPGGWEAEALVPPAALAAHSVFVSESADFSSSLWEMSAQTEPEVEEPSNSGQYTLDLREQGPGSAPDVVEVGPEDGPEAQSHSFDLVGASHDLSTVVFVLSAKKTHWPGDTSHPASPSLYSYTGVGNREPTLVGVSNEGPLVGSKYRNEHAVLISECGTQLGFGSGANANTFNAVSADGSTIYFTALHETCVSPTVNELDARVDGASTVMISEPSLQGREGTGEDECSGVCREDEREEGGGTRSPASFQGASEDGTKVYFTTSQPLVNADKDSTSDLYEADLRDGTLAGITLVSKGTNTGGSEVEDPSPGTGADVMDVVRVSEDGSHVYFVAKGVLRQTSLSEREEGRESAQAGGYNLYDYDSETDQTSLVSVLLPAAEVDALEAAVNAEEEQVVQATKAQCEAEAAEPEPNEEDLEECETELAQEQQALPANVARKSQERAETITGLAGDEPPFETTADGQFLIFESARDLTGAEDTSSVEQLFEYDSATRKLVRTSIGQEGYGGNGNTADPEDVPHIVSPSYAHGAEPTAAAASLSVSTQGAVFFTSRDRLTSTAKEGGENIYEYEPAGVGRCAATVTAGCVGLISAGDETGSAETRHKPRLLGVDQGGQDVFFATLDSLLPQLDIDSQIDWYDARVEGGFAEPLATHGCETDCQGEPPPGPDLPSSGGSATTAGEAPPAQLAPASKLAPAPKPLTRAQKLAKALKTCHRERPRQRKTCEATAKKKYGPRITAKRSRPKKTSSARKRS
jgi:hypothetical protein